MQLSDDNTKINLLKLYQILHTNNHEDRPISRVEFCQRVHEDVQCYMRTDSRDITTLNRAEDDDISFKEDHGEVLLPSREFSVHELKILIYSIHEVIFVAEKKTIELIEKIAMLGGRHCKKLLKMKHGVFQFAEALERVHTL